MQMGGFRLRALASENFFVRGSPDLDLRRREAITALDCYESDDIAALCLRDSTQLMLLPVGEDIRVANIVSNSQNMNLIPNNFHYRHETTKDSWVANISEDDASRIASSDSIWEGVLTISTLKRLLSENLITFPTITENEINDRSKGDALSKGIALLQLTWFVVQIITRATQGLAITELELTTAALAGLNSIMYFFWWSKPCDIRFPVVIQTKGVEELLAQRTDKITWRFPKHDFDIWIHLLISLITSFEEMVDSTGTFIVSLPARVMRTLLELVGAFCVVPRYFYSHLSEVYRYLARTIGGLKDLKRAESNYTKATDEGGNAASEVVGQEATADAHSASSHSSDVDMSCMQVSNRSVFSNVESAWLTVCILK